MNISNLQNVIEELSACGIIENIYVRAGTSEGLLIDFPFSKNGKTDEKTLFDMASITKIIATTSLALIAIDRGMLSLDDEVSNYFPKEKTVV